MTRPAALATETSTIFNAIRSGAGQECSCEPLCQGTATTGQRLRHQSIAGLRGATSPSTLCPRSGPPACSPAGRAFNGQEAPIEALPWRCTASAAPDGAAIDQWVMSSRIRRTGYPCLQNAKYPLSQLLNASLSRSAASIRAAQSWNINIKEPECRILSSTDRRSMLGPRMGNVHDGAAAQRFSRCSGTH